LYSESGALSTDRPPGYYSGSQGADAMRVRALLVGLVFLAGCPAAAPQETAGPPVDKVRPPPREQAAWRELARVRELVREARANGAERCAPADLDRAELALLLAGKKLKLGEVGAAERETRLAESSATRALARSPRVRCARGARAPGVEESNRADSDGDGVPDAVDKCPNDPEDRDGFQDQDGCPDPDNDGDGVPDDKDNCPDHAGPAAASGCPTQ
jgi:hypothetical protein